MKDLSFEKMREKAFRYLGHRARTYKEVYEKLNEYGASEEIIRQVMTLLLEYGYVDDKQYAKDYIFERSRKHGLHRIRHELKQKGVSDNDIREAAAESDLNECAAAVEQLNKRLSRFAEDENIDDKEKRRCYDYLARRGFSHDTIKEAFRELSL